MLTVDTDFDVAKILNFIKSNIKTQLSFDFSKCATNDIQRARVLYLVESQINHRFISNNLIFDKISSKPEFKLPYNIYNKFLIQCDANIKQQCCKIIA